MPIVLVCAHGLGKEALKVDAAILGQLLRADLLPEAWIAPLDVRWQRALLHHRFQLVRLWTLLRNRVHAILADHTGQTPWGHLPAEGRGRGHVRSHADHLPGGTNDARPTLLSSSRT